MQYQLHKAVFQHMVQIDFCLDKPISEIYTSHAGLPQTVLKLFESTNKYSIT